MNPQSEWALLASFSHSYEAEFAALPIRDNGIPVLIKGLEVGIWGPGHAGPTTEGLSVWVPENRLEEARELLIPMGDDDDLDP